MKLHVRLLSAACLLAFIAGLYYPAAAAKDGGTKVASQRGPIKLHRAGKSTTPGGRKTLSVVPENVAALVGETVVLSCESVDAPPLSRIIWAEYITSPFGSIISDNELIQNHPNRDRYSILQATDTSFYLEIRNLQITDGGTYSCQDSLGALPEDNIGEAELIVIASNPNCTNTLPADGNVIEGNSHTLECVVYFQGGFGPNMTWSGPAPFITGGASNVDNVWSGLQFIVDRSMDTRAFSCLTYFATRPEPPTGVAGNVPEWSFLFRAHQMFVYWGPKNMYVTPIQPEYVVGETLTCIADAYPAANYTWQNLRTTEQFSGNVFLITPDLAGTNQTMRCLAVNTIQGFIYSNNIFTVVYVPIATSPTTPPTTPEPTTPALDAPCTDLSGFWRSDNPRAELGLTVYTEGEIGEIFGLLKNGTDDIYLEVIGTVDLAEFSLVGLSSIYPGNVGVFGFSGECHRCVGNEVLFFGSIWRSITDSASCGDGGSPGPRDAYSFYRVSTFAEAYKAPIKVHKPTDVSRRLGVKLQKY